VVINRKRPESVWPFTSVRLNYTPRAAKPMNTGV